MGRRIGGAGGGSDPGAGKGGAVIAAAVVALAGAAGIGGEAALSAGTATGGSTPGLNARKADSKKNAREGDADGALIGLADIRFTAHHYWSETRGNTITIAESEPATGHVEPDLLDAMTEVAAQLPRP
ncbi:hypothetical protein ADK67_01640 [Saccharothrix sp. NRRL B-16348]|uniref:hypothetical protein n=1 Tax=Saccharothrix sp. NRRL B-16348 TaxID=1415542 RepID=UPI0006B035BA|nr:hypothetical protein [Saccharothrix sp. NRRL B-16348]KOX35187.1 hypothetical protein ADK67_01640 [Saccharothrix sp. NRRL B-16348]